MPQVSLIDGSWESFAPPVTVTYRTSAGAKAAQKALDAIQAEVDSGHAIDKGGVVVKVARASISSSRVPLGLEFVSGSPTTESVRSSNSDVVAFFSNLSKVTTITDAQSVATRVLVGEGGLDYRQTATSVTGSLIAVGGGSSRIFLAAGHDVVSLDISPSHKVKGVSTGSALVEAQHGGATVYLRPDVNNATTKDTADIFAAADDTLDIAGWADVHLLDATNDVTVEDGGFAAFVNGSAFQAATTVDLARGHEKISVATGSSENFVGATTALGANVEIFLGGRGLAGNVVIDPNAQNVLIDSGGGVDTLLGTGDAPGAVNKGTDQVFGGVGVFHAGSGGHSWLESATDITGPTTILKGGGVGDMLFAQSFDVEMFGSAGTSLMDAGGYDIHAGVLHIGDLGPRDVGGHNVAVDGAKGGVMIFAGDSDAHIYGSTAGGNTIVAGSDSCVVTGHTGATAGTGNTYMAGAAGGSMRITDFEDIDFFRLTAGETVSSVTGDLVKLSDGNKITISDGLVTSANVTTFFHS